MPINDTATSSTTGILQISYCWRSEKIKRSQLVFFCILELVDYFIKPKKHFVMFVKSMSIKSVLRLLTGNFFGAFGIDKKM